MIRRFRIFLGPSRFRAFILLLVTTGMISLALSVVAEASWATTLQTISLLVFVVGTGYLILGRLPREERRRWLAIIAPSMLAMLIASFLLPHLTGLFFGAGIGWMVAGIFIFNNFGSSQHYKRAIRAMRKGDHATAISEVSAQIKGEPERGDHYRFRAELYRLDGNLHLARRDYRKMIDLQQNLAVAYNGLAEVELQARNYQAALAAAERAYELAPEEWIAAYNLGMIEDRLRKSEAAVKHLLAALQSKIPDSRHRLLVRLYLLRAYVRLDNRAEAQAQFEALKKEKVGLEEWQTIMGAEEAAALRDVLLDDVNLARALISSGQPLESLMAEAL